MHGKTYIKNFLKERIGVTKTQEDVEQLHKFFETYIKYMALTAIRLQGGKYAASRTYVRKAWIPCSLEQVKKIVLCLLGKKSTDKAYWERLMQQNKRLNTLLDLLFNYAIRVRNLIFHGNYYPFGEEEEVFIYNIYSETLKGMEQLIGKHYKGKTILNDNPTSFGAGKGNLDRPNQLKKILRFQAANLPYTYDKAKQTYNYL